MGVIEFNEVFVVQSFVCICEFGLVDNDLCINFNGGVIVIGYLLGVLGICISYLLVLELYEKDVCYGLVVMCVGVGQGYVMIIEKV